MACSDSKEKIDMMLDEFQALRQLNAHSMSGILQHSAQDLDSIKQDIRHLANLSDSNNVTAERIELGLIGLQEEVKVLETKVSFALRDAVEQHKLPQVLTDLDTSQRQVPSLQDVTLSLSQFRGKRRRRLAWNVEVHVRGAVHAVDLTDHLPLLVISERRDRQHTFSIDFYLLLVTIVHVGVDTPHEFCTRAAHLGGCLGDDRHPVVQGEGRISECPARVCELEHLLLDLCTIWTQRV